MAQDIAKQLERARRSLEKNKLRDAVAEYQAIFDESPTNQEAIQALADLYLRLSDPVSAAHFYGLQFDRLLESADAAKASAIYGRFLRGVPQPPERLLRYAMVLQKQSRIGEAIEQYDVAADRFLEMHRDAEALDCYERIAQLDADNAGRHVVIGELAEKLGQTELAARSFLRAGQLSQGMTQIDSALEHFGRAHRLLPKERTIALFFAEARLRKGDAPGAVELLQPFSVSESDTTYLALFGEALLRMGQLDRAREAFVAFYRQRQDSFAKLFELAGAYFRAEQDDNAIDVLNQAKSWMKIAGRENEFAAQADRMATVHPNSIPLASLIAALYEELNREAKYFDSLVRLFDLYLDAGHVKEACEVLDRLVDIDPYDYRNQERIKRLEGQAEPSFLKSILSRAAKAATMPSRPEGFGGSSSERGAPMSEEMRHQQALEDLLVQVEIFLQYSLHGKAVERLERIAEMFPGEEEKNERLRTVYERANWWPNGKPVKPAQRPAVAPSAAANPAQSSFAPQALNIGFDAETQRDLAEIAEFTRLMYRQATPREVVSVAVKEIGKYLNASRCIVSVSMGKETAPLMAEFTGPGVVPAGGAQISAVLTQLSTVPPNALGGIELDESGIGPLRGLKLESALGVRLVDKETQTPEGSLLVGSERQRKWKPNESFFLQAVGDQLLISVNHTRTQAAVRTLAFADEKTGLVSRGAYLDCLMAEASRARAQNAPLSLVILQIERGKELLNQHGDAALDRYIEQLAQSMRGAVRQTDLMVKYTAWSLAFVLPDTGIGNAKVLAEKLRQVAAAVQAPWNGKGLRVSAVVAEATSRQGDENEDRVTEWINRAETGLDELRQQADAQLLVLNTP
ncbi:MAG TPA: diguanylate cyclase [Candidatus Acidoferrales bacterium]|nr:diguanylate cyclase [Candidatus Acidoferrales bacterium]